MIKSYRYGLLPSKSQVRILERQLELCRRADSDALTCWKDAWEKKHRQVKRFETGNRLPQLKVEHLQFKEAHSLTLLDAIMLRVELSLKEFFRRIQAGERPVYPRFKGKGRYDSLTYTKSGFGLCSGKINISKIAVLVDPRRTSQMCSRYGLTVKKDISKRIHSCPECSLSMDRDLNGAINITGLGMQSLRKIDRIPAFLGGEHSLRFEDTVT
jgi:putative transposase